MVLSQARAGAFAMMKWLTITALGSIGSYVGWNAGVRFLSGTAGLWLSLIGGIAGTAGAYLIIPRD
jgi:hypothetical protein